ncbi:hypothetical protein FIT60_29510, partial [Pseudomonas aeruginosa]
PPPPPPPRSFFSRRRRHPRCRSVSWARRCVSPPGGGAGGGAGHERQAQEDKGQAMESHDFIP